MKRKGFTIVEIVISLVILVAIGLVVGVGLQKVFKNNQEEETGSFEDKIISSTDLYLANNQTLTNELQTVKGYLLINVSELIEAGLLDENIIDPVTGNKIAEDTKVKVSLDSSGLLKIEYNVSSPNEPYLEAQTLNIDYNKSFICKNISSYTTEWGTQTLRLIDINGNVVSSSINDVITNVDCEIDTSKPGSYEITYTYKVPGNTELKSLVRNVIVGASTNDIVTLTAVANPKSVVINNNVSFTVTGTNRVGNSVPLKDYEYTISTYSTKSIGSFSPIVTYNGTNSDGSKPTTTANYSVVYDPNDIVSISAKPSATTIILNDNVTYTVTGTTRSGSVKTLTTSDYTVTGSTTSKAGVVKPTFTYSKTNSDGSKPTTTTSFAVIDDITAIINLDQNCTKQSDSSCWYIGNQSGNYVSYLGKTWRIYKKDSSGSLSLILNDTTGTNYAFTYYEDVYYCSPSACCNSSNSLAYSTSRYLVNQDPNGLFTHLNRFLTNLSGTKTYIKMSQFNISKYNEVNTTLTNNIGLLSYPEYAKIANCSTFSCNSNYLTISSNWGLGNYYNLNKSYSYSYDISSSGYNRTRTPKYHESLYINNSGSVGIANGAWALRTTDRYVTSSAGTLLAVRPVIVLNNNVKIQSGNGTASNPYKIV